MSIPPRTIRLRRIKAGSLFKLIFIGTGTIFVPLFLLFGILALFGAKTVTISGEYVTGIKGLIAAIVMAPFFTLIVTLFAWFGAYLGLRVWGHFRTLVIEYVPAEEESV